MEKQHAIEVAAPFFNNHTVNELFVTADSNVFFKEQDAINHAPGLRDKPTPVKVDRKDCEGDKEALAFEQELEAAQLNNGSGEPEKEINQPVGEEKNNKKKK